MKIRKQRVETIIELLSTQDISNQQELSEILREKGHHVTQATLSRDLRMLHTKKVPNNKGGYSYILPETTSVHDRMLASMQDFQRPTRTGFISLNFSGNIAIIKTRNGYAQGVAYDLDSSNFPEIMGTIAGSNTVMVVLREGISQEQAINVLARILPLND